MCDERVPVRRAPDDARTRSLLEGFERAFGARAQFVARVPGRVNLIGEHVDYCGFPVLPMALQQDVLVAVSVDPSERDTPVLRLRNHDPRYPPHERKLDDIHIEIGQGGKPEWHDYVLCGIKGGIEYAKKRAAGSVSMYVWGVVPEAAGLSSSSALVSAACLAYARAAGADATKRDMAALCAASERHVGTQGGGMDQAIAFLARGGEAQYITWDPLTATPVPLPRDAVFVVAHSGVRANKAATNDFNRRVVECRLAAAVLAKLNDVHFDRAATLCDVRKALKRSLDDMAELAKRQLPMNVYSTERVCELLEIDEKELARRYLTKNTTHLTQFKLRQRATHVFEEAARVERFRELCLDARNGDADEDEGRGVVRRLGELMRSSHASLEELYECSHARIDRLVRVSDGAGAHARVTGAGWGGCVVALCHVSQLDSYVDALRRNYYADCDDFDRLVFTTVPNDGAEIYIN